MVNRCNLCINHEIKLSFPNNNMLHLNSTHQKILFIIENRIKNKKIICIENKKFIIVNLQISKNKYISVLLPK